MFFDSLEYAVFLAVVLVLYWLSSHRLQNGLLLVASYFFYGWWDWRFLSLILLSTLLDYGCGRAIGEGAASRRRIWLACSLLGNLSILGFYKYADFFLENVRAGATALGWEASIPMLELVLPVGISFYTFQTMGYTIDVFRRKVEPERDLLNFALYVSFFPQLVAGPIERAGQLMPQIRGRRRWDGAAIREGGWLIFWGLYKKVFIADNLAAVVDGVYTSPTDPSAWMVLLATYAFAFQIYCDFSGYTDIARGTAKWLGFDLRLNFDLPYFAINPSDFWRRWHITLSEWLRDYLYIPLGGNRWGKWMTLRNLVITMGLGGLWHGAEWNFVAWGLYHGTLLVGYRLLAGPPEAQRPGWWRAAAIIIMFHWTCLGWMFFRVEEIGDMWVLLGGMDDWAWSAAAGNAAWQLLAFGWLVVVVQAFQYRTSDLLVVFRTPAAVRVVLYIMMYFSLTIYGAFDAQPFIYFQF